MFLLCHICSLHLINLSLLLDIEHTLVCPPQGISHFDITFITQRLPPDHTGQALDPYLLAHQALELGVEHVL